MIGLGYTEQRFSVITGLPHWIVNSHSHFLERIIGMGRYVVRLRYLARAVGLHVCHEIHKIASLGLTVSTDGNSGQVIFGKEQHNKTKLSEELISR